MSDISSSVAHYVTFKAHMVVANLNIAVVCCQFWGGVTKPVSSFYYFPNFLNIVKTHISYWIAHLYLTGVAAAEL